MNNDESTKIGQRCNGDVLEELHDCGELKQTQPLNPPVQHAASSTGAYGSSPFCSGPQTEAIFLVS